MGCFSQHIRLVRCCAVGLKRVPIDNTPELIERSKRERRPECNASQENVRGVRADYGRRPVNQDEMVMWLKSSEYRAAIRPHLDADGEIIA
jgi:hypothetical protein